VSAPPTSPTRADEIREAAAELTAIRDLDELDGAVDALAEAVVDACLATDGPAMEAAASALRVAASDLETRDAASDPPDAVAWAQQRGRVAGFGDVLRWMLRARNAQTAAATLEPGSHAHRMLSFVGADADGPSERLNSSEIGARLKVDKTQVSRAGRDLIERGLVVTTTLGRRTYWDITPRGRYALTHLGALTSNGTPEEEAPIALLFEDQPMEQAQKAAAAVARAHTNARAYVVGSQAWRAGRAGGSRREHGAMIVIDAPGGNRSGLADTARRLTAPLKPRQLDVAAGADGHVYSVLAHRDGATKQRPPRPVGRGRPAGRIKS
jgi:DNA-binding MarR family transcriptional regulator